ncbi:MAG TPA: Smr/MutS family protein [Verrucomicrobiales bacterium]|nr:Smr/MutS family protein [Verrucomicrobiales bacterium]
MTTSDTNGPDSTSEPDPVHVPITGELDLHTFRPGEIGSLLPEYFAESCRAGIYEVRVVHGKGAGALREGVHRILERLPEVDSFVWPASADSGGWGATWVRLKGRRAP